MKTSQKRKRIFGVCILFFMLALALTTAVMAASSNWVADGSYSLVIHKQFATKVEQVNEKGEKVMVDVPEAVLDEAMKQTYSFRVKGYRLDRNRNEHPIDEIITIGPNQNWQSEKLGSDGPIHVSVTEITNNITLEVTDENGVKKEYNMGDSRAETVTLFDESPQVRELNNNGKIVLSRPAKKTITVNGKDKEVDVTTTSIFRITSEWNAADSAKPVGWQPFSEIVTLAPGGRWERTGLSAGKYTIEDLSVSGYTVKLGPRSETVIPETGTGDDPSTAAYSARAGETTEEGHGTFYINSWPGTLTITAGGEKNDGGRHYYTIKRVDAPDGALPFTDRTTDAVLSGDSYTLPDLPRGRYEVTEYTFSDALTEFTVKVPQTDERERTGKSSALTSGTTNSWKYIDLKDNKFDVDYIKMVSFGPLYNSSGGSLNSSTSYATFRYGIANEDGTKITNIKSHTKGYTGNKTVTITGAPELPVGPQKRLYFTVTGLKSTSAKTIGVKWIEYDEKEVTKTFKDANINNSITIDDRGWMEITAPEGTSGITYTYYLRKPESETPIKTITLMPGQAEKIEGLSAGTYLVMEVANYGKPVGFTMDIQGGPVGTTEAGKSSEITVMDERTLTITKPQGNAGDTRDYTFIIDRVEKTRSGVNTQSEITFPHEVTIKAGQTSIPITLPAGTYTVTPVDDLTEIFEMRCSDSSQVHAEVAGASSVTFTNVFTPGTLGYRYVHEYYIFDPDTGKYTYEGNSPITTVGGRSDPSEFYNSVDITKEPVFTYEEQTFHYAYMPENNGYGRVVTDANVDSTADNGLRQRNRAFEKGKETGKEEDKIRYQVDNDLTQAKKIGVDKDKTQVIILRYFRVLEKDQKGSYNYIHIYYRRDKNGDHWEGTSPITDNVPGQLDVKYSFDRNITPLEPNYRPNGSDKTYYYKFDERPNYGTLTDDHTAPHIEHEVIPGFNDKENSSLHYHYNPNSNANYIVPTAEGNQIIILRYYREVKDEATTGTYKVVHEYYYREEMEDTGGAEDSGSEDTGGEETENEGGETKTAPTDLDPAPPATTPGPSDDTPATDTGTAPETGGDTPATPPDDEGGGSSDAPPAGDEDSKKDPDTGASDAGDKSQGGENSGDPPDTNAPETVDPPQNSSTEGEDKPPEGSDADGPKDEDQPENDPAAAPAVLSDAEPADDENSAVDEEQPKEPEGGEQTTPPEGGEQTTPPEGDEQTPPPEDGEQTTPPEGGEQTPPPENGEQAPPPENGGQAQAPGNGDPGDGSDPNEPENSGPQGSDQLQTPGNSLPEGDDKSEDPGNSIAESGEQLQDLEDDETESGGTSQDPGKGGTLSSDDQFTYRFEGRSERIEIITAPLGTQHWGEEVTPQLVYSGETYSCLPSQWAVYGIANEDGTYRQVTDMEWAASTVDENHIIILRYVRGDDVPVTPPPVTPSPPPPSYEDDPTYAYRVVHEYYLEDADGNRTLEGRTKVNRVDSSSAKNYDQSDVTKLPTYDGREYKYTEDAYGKWSGGQNYKVEDGKTYVTANSSGNQIIILRYVRTEAPAEKGGYRVVHEYYLRGPDGQDILEGISSVEMVDGLSLDETQYTASGVAHRPEYGERTYTWFQDGYGLAQEDSYSAQAGMEHVIATEDGEQIIILRYYRETGEDKPTDPVPTPSPTPTPTPPPPYTPPPEYPKELPNPNDPDSPPKITIWDDDVPKIYVKVWNPVTEEWIYVPEGEIPLWNVDPQPVIVPEPVIDPQPVIVPEPVMDPQPNTAMVPATGDRSRPVLWAALAAASLCGLVVLILVPGERKTRSGKRKD